MARVRWSPQARKDLESISDYYREVAPSYAERFEEQVLEVTRRLEIFPRSGRVIPEAEVFLGKIGVAKYQTPGTPENADEVGEVGVTHQAILMQNHGVIVWGKDVEDAYWKMENIDSYCRTVWIAAGLGSGLHRFTPGQQRDLINLRQKLGMPDPRADWKECELCDNAEWRPGVTCSVPAKPVRAAEFDAEAETAVQAITDQIMSRLK